MALHVVPSRSAAEESAPEAEVPTPRAPLSRLSGWGRHPVVEASEALSEDLERVTRGVVLTRGLGRSYGDASLPPSSGYRVAGTVLADRALAFDADTGLVRVEAGCPLWRLNRLFLARGFFTPVTPGTHFVTIGGMVAADVHGKSHHRDGCFGEHVTRLKMRVPDGRIVECRDDHEPELLRATLGGMGLTGHILEVEFRLQRIPSPWIVQESVRTESFEATLETLRVSSAAWPMTVCWADFMIKGRAAGRGIVQRGRWAEPDEAPASVPTFRHPLSLPPVFPSWFLQEWLVRAFNRVNHAWHGAAQQRRILHPETFFYPLDIVRDWNRLYGPRGFTQYQCVLPVTADVSRHRGLLTLVQDLDAPVFLCVIKDCGDEGKGMLSFPKRGVSYALDLPVSPRTQSIVDALNEFVIAADGRVYLAKDAFTRAEHWRAMEPRLEAWSAVRRRWDPHATLRSAQSVRLFGDQP